MKGQQRLQTGPSQSWGSGGLHDVRARPLAFGPDFHQPQNPSHASTLGQRTSAEIPDLRRTPNLATVPCSSPHRRFYRFSSIISGGWDLTSELAPENETVG